MKIKWSVFYTLTLLMALASCGSEQFGTVPQSETNTITGPTGFQQMGCTSHTLIKPKVDVLYVVDNSLSAFQIRSEVRTAIQNTVATISDKFDYRIISIPLVNIHDPDGTSSVMDQNYRVLTNSDDSLPNSSNRVISSQELITFPNDGNAMERGLVRTYKFINQHQGYTGSLFRTSAHKIIVLASNGRDDFIQDDTGNPSTSQYNTLYANILANFQSLKSSATNSPMVRFLSVTSKSSCGKSATDTYDRLSRDLYSWQHLSDNPNSLKDTYDICSSGFSSSLFSAINQIQQVIVPHTYRFWPITFAKPTDTKSMFSDVKVWKVTGNSAPVELPTASWTWEATPSGSRNIREPGTEVVPGHHFIRFSNLISYPDCIQVTARERTEYYKYIVLPRKPKPESIYVTINGNPISRRVGSGDGWEYRNNITVPNIKVEHPAGSGNHLPAIPKAGFMIELHGSGNYYKSGDSVQVNYIPDAI